MGKVYRRAAARRDLIAHYAYLAENADEAIADRFLNHAEASFDDLADQRMIGVPLATRHPSLIGIRKWRVRGFDNYLIFYLPRPDGVSIIRVLYAAQDWWRLLGTEG
jgi:toxin ParE1/3/4